MLYEFTYPDRWCGHLVSEIDMRAEIVGDPDDWTVETLEFWTLDGGRKNEWVEMPREHLRRAEIIAYLTSINMAAKIDEAYVDHIVNVEGLDLPRFADEHRLTKRELV